MNITQEDAVHSVPNQEVTLEVELLSLAMELAITTYGVEYEQSHLEYFKHLIKKHSK